MAHKHPFPEGFSTETSNNRVLTINDKNGNFLAAFDIESLAAKLLNGEHISFAAKQYAGAALVHLLAKMK